MTCLLLENAQTGGHIQQAFSHQDKIPLTVPLAEALSAYQTFVELLAHLLELQ